MAKLIIALSLLFSGANAMGVYGGTAQPSAEPTGAPQLNGCGEPCAGVVSIKAKPFPPIEAGTCYVIDGEYPTTRLGVAVACAKITIPKDSSLNAIDVHLPRLFFCPVLHDSGHEKR